MSLGDRIRRFFAKKSNPALGQLEEFARERKGVEGYIEPKTPTSSTSLLLVDREGEHLRAAVEDPETAAAFCDGLAIPVYDAQVLGYPKRMRDYEKRRRAEATEALDETIADLERQFAEEPPK